MTVRPTCRGFDVIAFEVTGLQRTWVLNSRALPVVGLMSYHLATPQQSNVDL